MLATRFGFKTKKVFVKVVGQEVVSVGFPETSLSHYFPEAVVCDGIVTVSMDADDADFEQWIMALSCSSAGYALLKDRTEAADIVLSRISKFPVESSSPIDCMMLLLELKKIIHGCNIR